MKEITEKTASSILAEIDAKHIQEGEDAIGDTLKAIREVISSNANSTSIINSLSSIPPRNRFVTWLVSLQCLNWDNTLSVCAQAPLCFRFVEECSGEQVSRFPVKFTMMAKSYIEKCIDQSKPAAAIRFTKLAINLLSPGPHHLTPLHPLFLLLCILSKMYHLAESLLEIPIYEVDELTKKRILAPLDALTYYYYGGIIYIALKKFDKAYDFLSMAVSVPGHALSQVAIEAFKKFILVSLILGGNPDNVPKTFSPVVSKRAKTLLSNNYFAYAKAFEPKSTHGIQELLTKHSNDFAKDSNLGLAKQAANSIYKRNISKLTQAYVTLSLGDISTNISLPVSKVESLLLEMIHLGEIYAKINQRDGMVSFYANPEKYDNNITIDSMDLKIRRTIELGNMLQDLQNKVLLSSAYLNKVAGTEKLPTSEDGQHEEQGERQFGGVSMH